MAGLREIKRRIKSVSNTRKITYAMKLVSAAKLRKAQEKVTKAKEYTEALSGLLRKIACEQGDNGFLHPLMRSNNEAKTVRLLAVGGSRGLCGSYNSHVVKALDRFFAEQTKAGREIESIAFGKKVGEHFRRVKQPYLESYETLPDDPAEWPINEIYQQLEHDFTDGKLAEVYIIYTEFYSALSMAVKTKKLLPLEREVLEPSAESPAAVSGQILFEPSIQEVFAAVVPKSVRAMIYLGCLEAVTSEHGSRMTAMDTSTKNADELIGALTLTHNKLRQSSITADLLDIIGGSAVAES